MVCRLQCLALVQDNGWHCQAAWTWARHVHLPLGSRVVRTCSFLLGLPLSNSVKLTNELHCIDIWRMYCRWFST